MKPQSLLRAGLWALSALITSMAQVSTTPVSHSALLLDATPHQVATVRR